MKPGTSNPHAQFVARRGELKNVPPIAAFPNQHFNAVTSWAVDAKGQISHAYT
jgi:sulfane dehydrogenase subunit SoxC